ncbi:DUF1178 family protein [Pararhodobacter sp.]|uniref:DUF1178 family protein n=1 Tax=Pararhodobacter sp. TaxID=2127056 RepID=UPI002AFF1B2D|nr:DUF1178 family protein [Pararhodobacter sp.]
MIRYTLKCDQGHDFESWFASATAFDSLLKGGHVACVECGSVRIEKALMAPAVALTTTKPAAPGPHNTNQKLAALRREIEENADYVGNRFVAEARAMHLGDAPDRPIWGEARLDEAKALLDDGVSVMPLPFLPKTKTN